MANKKNLTKLKIMEENTKLLEVLIFLFQGQVLEMDLKEFCVEHKIYDTENKFNQAIKNLKSKKVIRTDVKLVKTTHNVVIACKPALDFLAVNKKIVYSVETVTRNSYTNYILNNHICKNVDFQNVGVYSIYKTLKNNSTLLTTKRDVEGCYKPFKNNLNTMGLMAKEQDLQKEIKRKSKLKNQEPETNKSDETNEKVEPIAIKETLKTLRESDIYIFVSKGKEYHIYITDNNSNYQLHNLSKKIDKAIRVLCEHTEVLQKAQIYVIVKDKTTKMKLENSFVKEYAGSQNIAIVESLNKKFKNKTKKNLNFEFIKKDSSDYYVLENIYKREIDVIQKIFLKLEDTDIARRHNSDLRALAMVIQQEEQKAKRMEEEIERRAEELLEQWKEKNR